MWLSIKQLEMSIMLLELSIMLLGLSIMLLESSIMLPENIYSAGITNEDPHMMNVICLKYSPQILVSEVLPLKKTELKSDLDF
jgi:hypothetical protein